MPCFAVETLFWNSLPLLSRTNARFKNVFPARCSLYEMSFEHLFDNHFWCYGYCENVLPAEVSHERPDTTKVYI